MKSKQKQEEPSSFSNDAMETGTEFKLFASGEAFGFSDFPSKNPPPPSPPPPQEVVPSQVSSSANFLVEPVHFDNLTLLKGRVSTKEVFGLPNSDLVPGVYEGGLKLWEGSLDLVKVLLSEVQNGTLSFSGKRVLELGCGHGIPGIFACVQGASAVHFQDYNAEVLQCLTIPNVNANIPDIVYSSSNEASSNTRRDVRFFAGDWSQINKLLPYVCQDAKDSLTQNLVGGYDIILMAETIYSLSTHHTLYKLLKMCVGRSGGTVYMAAKKYYFGVGGGIRQFLSLVEKDDVLVASRIAEVADGSSNVREVWKLTVR